MKLTSYGHACYYLETGKTKIIIDPFLNENPQAVIKPDDVKAEWILVTHGHYDHMGDAVEIASKNNATIVSISEVAKYCGSQGVKTHAMYIGGKYNFGQFAVKITLALHGSSIGGNPIQYLGQPCGFLIFVEGKTIYFAGDTGLFGDMGLIGKMHPIDLAILPIGDNFTMGPEDALEAVRMIKPKMVIPTHYNTWDIIKQNPEAFKEAVELNTDIPVTVLNPGSSCTL